MRIGLVGTGYAAKLRADAVQGEAHRATLVAVAGHAPERTQEFSQTYRAIACESWQELLARPDLDLVIIATANHLHGAIAQAALRANKHVIVEYPLALEIAAAETAIALAAHHQKLLHVEHIELLGGVHQALKASLPLVGMPFFARYITLKPEHPAPQRWSYHPAQFGFPLIGALSRLHRLIDAFGTVATVSCQAQFWGQHDSHYSTCLCTAHLQFTSGLLAEVTYGKGAALWQAERTLTVQAEKGALVFAGEVGQWISPAGTEAIAIGGRRGLFAKDTTMVLDHLLNNTPLYITPDISLYTLKVADAARRSAETGRRVEVEEGIKNKG